jgi:hypothetical protein
MRMGGNRNDVIALLGAGGLFALLAIVSIAPPARAQTSAGDPFADSEWMETVAEVTVHPVERSETTQLIDAGTIETDGFTHVVLSLTGEMKEQPTRDGQIGVILIPDAPAFDKVLRDHRFFGFPLEVTASVSIDGKPFFMSEKKRELVAFPRYRVYFYNSTNRTATAWLFAYRTK